MGYAKLNFPIDTETSNVLYDIVRVIDGTVTATNSLSYASTLNSEIVNTLGENWTVLYGTKIPGTTAYVVTSTCVTSSKIHYVHLMNNDGVTGWNASNSMSADANCGVGLFSISGAASSTSVSNPIYYSTDPAAGDAGRSTVRTDSSNPHIYVHWSKHHVLLFGRNGDSTARLTFFGSFEYPENDLTTFYNTTPIVYLLKMKDFTTAFETSIVPDLGTVSGHIWQGVQFYQPLTGTISNIDLGQAGFGTIVDDFDPVRVLANDGSLQYPLIPMYWSIPSLGIPNINISTLSGVYKMPSYAGIVEDVFTVGGNSYLFLPLGTTLSAVGTQQSGIALLKK